MVKTACAFCELLFFQWIFFLIEKDKCLVCWFSPRAGLIWCQVHLLHPPCLCSSFSRCVDRDLEGKWGSGDSNEHVCGMPAPQGVASSKMPQRICLPVISTASSALSPFPSSTLLHKLCQQYKERGWKTYKRKLRETSTCNLKFWIL